MRSIFIAMTAFAALSFAAAGTANAATKGHHTSHKAECKKEAKEKSLKGAEAKSFIKDCVAQKKAPAADKPAAAQ